MFGFFRRRRHERLTAAPFPAEWSAHLEQNVPGVLALEEEHRAWLEDLIQIFIAEKRFEGAGGLEVTDEMRVTVAAQACLLLIGHDETWVYHHFAHQLDQDFAAADGAPELPRSMCYGTWAEVLGSAFARLQKAAERGRKSFLDAYGATHPAEFFAVATEAFFEKPVQMKKRAPELYEQLVAFYRQNPAERVPRGKASGTR